MNQVKLPPGPPGHVLVDVSTVVDTYPLRGRILCWVLWRTPLKYVARLFGKNPYCHIVSHWVPKAALRATPKMDLQPEAAGANTPPTGRESPAPGTNGA